MHKSKFFHYSNDLARIVFPQAHAQAAENIVAGQNRHVQGQKVFDVYFLAFALVARRRKLFQRGIRQTLRAIIDDLQQTHLSLEGARHE